MGPWNYPFQDMSGILWKNPESQTQENTIFSITVNSAKLRTQKLTYVKQGGHSDTNPEATTYSPTHHWHISVL